MSNNPPGFALVFNAAENSQLVDSRFAFDLIAGLEEVVGYGFSTFHRVDRRFPVRLHIFGAPEAGSVRITLAAILTGVTIGAGVVQISGIDLADIFQAVARVVAPKTKPDLPTTERGQRLARDPQFMDRVQQVVDTATQGGYNSIKIEVPGELTIELTTPEESSKTDPRILDRRSLVLRAQLAEDELLNLEEANSAEARRGTLNTSELNGRVAQARRELARIQAEIAKLDSELTRDPDAAP